MPRLVRPAVRSALPTLDPAQRAVVEHRGAPLLVLAGPGTGKTTTLVEVVVDRIDNDGLLPDDVLVLTFSRRAAAEIRDRIASRLGRVTREPLARTFHAYAFGLVRAEAAIDGRPAPTLLSGPEQDHRVRELLAGDAAGVGVQWPSHLAAAVPTRGFAREVRDLILRALEHGVDPAGLARLGAQHGRDDWAAASDFLQQYLAVGALTGQEAYDPARLVAEALRVVEDGAVARLPRLIVVDEYQDTDPMQERLLKRLVEHGAEVIAVGDPDQSIYAFRGSDVQNIHAFPERFRGPGGTPATTLALHTSRRCGPHLLAASRRLTARLGPGNHRHLTSGVDQPGRLDVQLLRSASDEAAFVAQSLRRAHLAGGTPWSSMAVLVRSAHALPLVRRALQAAGVPVALRADEVPLARQPVVEALLSVLRIAADPSSSVTADQAQHLLIGPLGTTDPLAVRRLRQVLRGYEHDQGGTRPSAELLAEAVDDPLALVGLNPAAVAPAATVAGVVAAARTAAAQPGAGAEDVLWAAWEASGRAAVWQKQALRGGRQGAPADRDLDAVVALFDAAARYADRLPGASLLSFAAHLDAQEIPSDSLSPSGVTEADTVTLMTAHASKGLEFDVVAVVGVQEGVWPDLRQRGTVLGGQALADAVTGMTPHSDPERVSRLLAEERRLFYVAVTRARQHLIVTAVDEEGDDARPSRFIAELLGPDEPPTVHRAGEHGPGLDRAALVAHLRRVVSDPGHDLPQREAAAHHLARFAASGVRGADPSQWSGVLPITDDAPLQPDPDVPVRVSPSRVESFARCGLRWLLESSGGSTTPSVSQGVGSLVHDLAHEAAAEALTADEVRQRFEQRWSSLDAGSGWMSRRYQSDARAMLERLLIWMEGRTSRLVDTEVSFETRVDRALLAGRVDRLERDENGRLLVLDLKTGSSKPATADVARHPQLGAYQVAVQAGAFGGLDAESVSGGAALVHLGAGKEAGLQVQPPLADDPDPDWARTLVRETAVAMAGSVFHAQQNSLCERCPVRSSCPVQPDGEQVLA